MQISQLIDQGMKYIDIAERYGVNPLIISRIARGVTWSSITGKKRRYGRNPHKGSAVVTAKLTEEQVIIIKRMLTGMQKHSDIARQFKVSRETITLIANNKTWTHVRDLALPE